MMSGYLCLFSPLGWPLTTFSIHWSIKVTFLKCSNPSQSLIIPETWRNPLTACVTFLPLKPSLWAEESSVLIGYTRVMWYQTHTNHLPWKRRLLFPKKARGKSNKCFSSLLVGSIWRKPEHFGKFYILTNCLSKTHKIDLINRWTV